MTRLGKILQAIGVLLLIGGILAGLPQLVASWFGGEFFTFGIPLTFAVASPALVMVALALPGLVVLGFGSYLVERAGKLR